MRYVNLANYYSQKNVNYFLEIVFESDEICLSDLINKAPYRSTCIFQIWHHSRVLLQPVNMRGVAQSQNQVSASSSPRYTYQDLFKSHGGHGLFDDVDIGKLKKSTTGGKGVKTESFTSDGYVFQFLNYGQVCSDKPIAVVGLTINTCLSDESGNSYIYTCNPSK